MDEALYTGLLRSISMVAGVLGVLIGLDLLCGAPVTTFLKRILDKCFDFDKIVENPRTKRTVGFIFLIFSAIILLLIRRT